MQIARVTHRMVATRKHSAYEGTKLLFVEVVDSKLEPTGEALMTVDLVDAGVGDLVLVCSEGRWAREQFGADAPIRSTIVAVLAGVDIELADNAGTQGPDR